MDIVTTFLIGFLPNPRIYKRITLARTYSKVNLICWDRGIAMLEKPNDDGFSSEVISIRAGSDPLSRLGPFRAFQKKAMNILKKQKPSIIHVQGLDMLQIACQYKNKYDKDVHIIYEIADLNRHIVDIQKSLVNRFIQVVLRNLDKKCTKQIDLLIITSEKYFDNYFANFVPKKKVFFFPNVPELSPFKDYKKSQTRIDFTIGYFGIIRYKQELKLLINGLRRNNIKLIIAGTEDNEHEIERLCTGRDDILWVGKYDFAKQASSLYQQCDAVYAVYDSTMNNCKVALPNKLYEAVYCELPIIVASDTYVGELVESWRVGIAVKHDSEEELDRAISFLKDKDKYNEIENNCKNHRKDVDISEYNDLLRNTIMSILHEKK